MRRRLKLLLATVSIVGGLVLPVNASTLDEQDTNCGLLIFEITRILSVNTRLEPDVRVALGASLEYLFIQLSRSESSASLDALARSSVLDLDAGGSVSRTNAILSKGKLISRNLARVQRNYRDLCSSRTDCMSLDHVTEYVQSLYPLLGKK